MKKIILSLIIVILPTLVEAADSLVILGDSIAFGQGASNGTKSFSAILAKKTTRYFVLNYSRGGWSVSANSGGIKPANINGVTALFPYAIIIALGTNDHALSVSAKAFRNSYRNMVTTMVNVSVERLYCLTPFPRTNEEIPNMVHLTMSDYRNIINEECERAGGVTIDSANMFLPNENYLTSDGLHPNDRGHSAAARHIWQQIGSELRIE